VVESIEVSVIINVHNGEAFLMEAVNSVLGQTFTNFELLIWNNCSTDATERIIELALKKDTRVRSHKTDFKSPLYEARNEAIRFSSGRFVAFLDSDDLWRKDKLSKSLRALSDSGADVFFSNFEIWNLINNSTRIAYKADLPKGQILKKLVTNYSVALSTLVFRKSAINAMEGPFNPIYTIIGDYDLVLRMAERYQFASSDLPLTTYRVHDSNLSTLEIDRRRLEISAWGTISPLSKSLNESDFRKAKASLDLDAVLADKARAKIRIFFALKLLVTPGFIVLLVSKFSWWAANNRLR
jgi:glycosyltransferase involved in cell wall biosynthesis